MTPSKNNLAILDALEVFEHGMKWAILEKWSTTTKMKLFFLGFWANPTQNPYSHLATECEVLTKGNTVLNSVSFVLPVDKSGTAK